MFASWETAWIFSRGNTGQCPYRVKVQKCTVTSWKDCGCICRTMEEKGKMSSSNTIHSVLLLFFLFPLAISLLFFFFACILPASRQGRCTRLTSCACVSLLFQYHHGIRPTASHHYNTESNIRRQFTSTIWPDHINSTLTPHTEKWLRVKLASQLLALLHKNCTKSMKKC